MSRDSVLIGASMAALIVLSLVSFFCSNRRRARTSPSSHPPQRSVVDDPELGWRPCAAGAAGIDIDDAVLAAYPTTVYSSPSRHQAVASGDERGKKEAAPDYETTCAVCLADYADGDELKRLPGCAHAFHRGCVDQWLRRQPSCPLCRTTPTASAWTGTQPSEVS